MTAPRFHPPSAPPDTGLMSLPSDASTHGHVVDALLSLQGKFDFALVVLMVVLLVGMVLLFGRRHPASPTADTARSRQLVLGVAL